VAEIASSAAAATSAPCGPGRVVTKWTCESAIKSRSRSAATVIPPAAPTTCATTYAAASAGGTRPSRRKASVTAGLRCAPDLRPNGEYVNAATVVPIATPMTARRSASEDSTAPSGDAGCHRTVA
jgi:hypothetical protein